MIKLLVLIITIIVFQLKLSIFKKIHLKKVIISKQFKFNFKVLEMKNKLNLKNLIYIVLLQKKILKAKKRHKIFKLNKKRTK